MKKLLLTVVAICAAELALAQGRVGFNNAGTFNASDAITIYSGNFGSNQGLVGQGIGGDKYSVQLIWVAGTGYNDATFYAANPTYGPVCTGVGSGGSLSAAFFANTGNVASGAGFFDAGVIPNPVGTTMPAGTYTMQVLAWYNVGSASYAAALNSAKNTGKSALFTVNATVAPTSVNSTVFPGFQVGDVPEPSTFSVAALAAAGMLWFRRKK